MDSRYIFAVLGYEGLTPAGKFFDMVRLEVYAHSLDHALVLCKSVIKKKFYTVDEVFEELEDGAWYPYAYLIHAYESMSDDGMLMNGVGLHLYGGSPEEALSYAKKLVKKKHYRVAKIIAQKPKK